MPIGSSEVRPRQVDADHGLDHADEEIEVLEGRERGEVENDAGIERPDAAAALMPQRQQP